MEKPDSFAGSGGSDVYNTFLIDTSLNTHLVMMVPDSDTVSDLKKKIMYEHLSLFPKLGEIKINALKVKRQGYLYHLTDSMFVKMAFRGVSEDWCVSVDAAHRENRNLACFGTEINNKSSADVVDLVPAATAKRLSNINDALLPQDVDGCHAKPSSASQQFGFSNSTKENSADCNSQVSAFAANTGSRSKVLSKDVGDDKRCADLPASGATSVSKKNQKFKKRKKDAIHHDLKENGALVVESGKDALDSGSELEENLFQNVLNLVLTDANLGNQIPVNETCRSLSSLRNKRSAGRKRMANEGTKLPGEHSELETNEHKNVSRNDQEHKSKENALQSGSVSKKRKLEKKDGNENSLIESGEQATGLDTATSKCTLGQKVEITTAAADHLNTESVKQNHLSAANASGGRKKRKRQKLSPSQAGNEVSSAKDVHVDTFQAIDAIKDKDLGSRADPESFVGKSSTGGEKSEHCPIYPMKMQEVSETNRVPYSEGDDDMDDTNDGILGSKNEAPEPTVSSVTKARDLCDQNSGHVDGHPIPVSQESINFRKAFGVSGHERQNGTLEEKIVEPKKSSKKLKKSKKTKGLVGGTEEVDAVHNRGPATDISSAKRPTFENGDHLSDIAEQGGKTDGKEKSKTEKPDCSPSVTDEIRDVLESLKQSSNGPENAENTEKSKKKTREKTKKKSSTVVAPPELQGKDDDDHWDPMVLVHNVSEVSAYSKSTRKTVKVNSSSAVQPEQNTVKPQHDGRPIQDVVGVDLPKSTRVDNANNSKEVPGGCETLKSQERHDLVDSGEIIIDKVTHNTGVETVVKGKKISKPELPFSEMLNGNQRKETKAQAVKSSSMQSQRSLLKAEPSSSNVKSSKPLLTVSGSLAKEPLQSNRSEKIDSTPKSAQRPIDINSSRADADLKKNNTRVESSSALETPRNTINLKKGGNEQQSDLDIGKAARSNSKKVANSLAKKKSILASTGMIFRHDDKERSDDEDGAGHSDSSTRTPSDTSSSAEDSGNNHENGNSSPIGSCNSKGEEAGGRNKQKLGSSSPMRMSLDAILRNSSNYKKSSTVVAPPDMQGKDDVDHRDPTVLVHNASEVTASSKSTRKTVKMKSSSAVRLNGSDLGSVQNTLEPQHDGRPLQDVVGVDHPKSTRLDNTNNSKEVPSGSETLKSQQRREIVDSGKIIISKVTHKTGVETVVKGKKISKPELPSSELLNGNKRKEAKAQAVKSSSVQSQRSVSKAEPSSSNVKSSKPLLIVSGSAAKEPLQSNRSEKIDSTPKSAQRPIDINSSRANTDLKKNNRRAVSSSAFETPKNTINLKKGGNERRSDLDIAIATGNNSKKVANSLANKKSLLASTGMIFRHDDNESSDDEDVVGNPDSYTRTISDSSSSDSSDNGHENVNSSLNGSYNSEGEEAGGRNKRKPGSSSPKRMSLDTILRNSSSYKKAKLTAAQDIDSQSVEFVPESLAT